VTASNEPADDAVASRNEPGPWSRLVGPEAAARLDDWMARYRAAQSEGRVRQFLKEQRAAREAELRADAAAGDRAARVKLAALTVSICGVCGQALDAAEPIWLRNLWTSGWRSTLAPVGRCCEPPSPCGGPLCYRCRGMGPCAWYPAPCEHCGRTVHYDRWNEDAVPKHPACSDQHRERAQAQRRRDQRAAARGDSQCEGCGETFTAARSDARYCSPACRQRSYRERKKGDDAHPATTRNGKASPR
jgi:hypothetical protein